MRREIYHVGIFPLCSLSSEFLIFGVIDIDTPVFCQLTMYNLAIRNSAKMCYKQQIFVEL